MLTLTDSLSAVYTGQTFHIKYADNFHFHLKNSAVHSGLRMESCEGNSVLTGNEWIKY